MGFFDKLKNAFSNENDKQPQATPATQEPVEVTEQVDAPVETTTDHQEAGASVGAINTGHLSEIFDHGVEAENEEAPVAAEDPVIDEAVIEEPPVSEEPAAVQEEAAVEAPVTEQAPADEVAAEPSRTYTVEAGDSLSVIGEKFGVDYMDIARINGIDNPDLIFTGQVLRIP